MTEYTFCLDVSVTNEVALYRSAKKRAISEGMSADHAAMTLREDGAMPLMNIVVLWEGKLLLSENSI